jgi:hypothetical protein
MASRAAKLSASCSGVKVAGISHLRVCDTAQFCIDPAGMSLRSAPFGAHGLADYAANHGLGG